MSDLYPRWKTADRIRYIVETVPSIRSFNSARILDKYSLYVDPFNPAVERRSQRVPMETLKINRNTNNQMLQEGLRALNHSNRQHLESLVAFAAICMHAPIFSIDHREAKHTWIHSCMVSSGFRGVEEANVTIRLRELIRPSR